MSNAEAITRIDRFLAYLEEIWTPQCDCEEALIRRDDITAFVIARDALKEARPHGEWTKESAIDYLTEIGWLPEHDRILTDRPHGEWIPVGERLPEKEGFYLITFKAFGDDRCVTKKFYRKTENLWTDDGVNRGFFFSPDEVTAWMPLPEPYKREGEAE